MLSLRVTGALLLVAVATAERLRTEAAETDDALRPKVAAAMKSAASYFHDRVALHGGYVYYYSPDLTKRLGEGVAAPDQIWVQSPGTPTVGLAFLAAYEATGDAAYRDAATDAARALVYGQLASGGWTNSVCFTPQSKLTGQYRNGRGNGRNYSTLDDGITQEALRFLIRTDKVLGFQNAEIHQAAKIALDALLAAQFPNGAFPQVWDRPVSPQPVRRAQYPDYDWRTENRIKEYWNLYTLNDDLVGYVSGTLLEAWATYDDPRCQQALVRLGDFLIAAQMPDPQPAWAQQYDYEMRPVWARKFEPPAVCGRESQDAMETLMKIYRLTGDPKYLAPIPAALKYLQASQLPDGRLARYYELQTNKPLYMTIDYQLTHDDRRVPDHYGWKTASRLKEIERAYEQLRAGSPTDARGPVATQPMVNLPELRQQAAELVKQLDEDGRWISAYAGEIMLTGQPKFRSGEQYLSSQVFSQNLTKLSEYLQASK